MNNMEPSRSLPKLPSERKAKCEEQKQKNSSAKNEMKSPTQVSGLVGGKSSESDHSITDEPAMPFFSRVTSINSSLEANSEEEHQDRKVRDEQLDRLKSVDPLPPSITAEKLLRFMNTTTQFMNSFEAEVSEKLDTCSDKISALDHQVSLIENRSPRLETTMERQS